MRFLAPLLVLMLLAPIATRATVPGVFPGDLIKLQSDGDKTTHEDEAVYYFDRDWFRHPFPNAKVYNSWYKDFSGIKELTMEQMAEIKLGAPIAYRPGTRLIKIPSVPKVYALEPGGVLRWLETEAVAKGLFGDDWAKRVDDVSESLFTSYKEGAPLTARVLPTGSIVRRASDDSLYFIEGYFKRHLSPAVAESIRVQEKFVLRSSSDLADYPDRADVVANDLNFTDAAEIWHIDIPGPPLIDFPVSLRSVERGKEQGITAFRVSSAPAIIIRELRVRLTGELWKNGQPMLTDLKFVDVAGQNMFGIKQLETSGASSETMIFSGAYTMLPNTVSVIELRATPSMSMTPGAKISIVIERDTLKMGEGLSDAKITDFYPRSAFPVTDLQVK
ncbi:hypothetical protein HY633_00100 [Candidatus Uhrbacteria bacterium]|nr:hypothetical protein [Candidatus Uhrbacteria bacterium]